MKRRNFVKTMGVAGASALSPVALEAQAPAGEFRGMLLDTTRCIGCRSCEIACAEAHDLPAPDLRPESLEATRPLSPTQFTVVNRHETAVGGVFLKDQCMHCDQPACASACLTKAMLKTEEGPVIWRSSKCMGCRMCMVACPFDVPKFEYHSAVPSIRKCDLCWERTQAGGQPACAEACPAQAITYGPRRSLVDEAHARIAAAPDRYVHQVFGEREAGGTGTLYLAGVDFGELGLPTHLETEPYPTLTKSFLMAVPVVFILWPSLLAGLSKGVAGREESTREDQP